ncbi:unnamed protein product [Plutella xylostella]|uniref:(diamondback moth) hypothetical protein n=1 Tax=Plutella xylostella TaxID=51655 RepID=A0A8S4G6Z4_PLUXY|nr:unnamed protein product [Plutella xylostella]
MQDSSGKRIAQEAQLLAEEKWIVDALRKIRSERNGLQIERLQLESMLTQLKYGKVSETATNDAVPQPIGPQSTATLEEKLLQSRSDTMAMFSVSQPMVEKSSEVQILDEGVCNFEELNLCVTNPVLNRKGALDSYNMDFDEEEEDDENETDNVLIDMNMFMNSAQDQD